MESTDIIAALRKSGGNVAAAATLLGVTRAGVYARIEREPLIASAMRGARKRSTKPKGSIASAVETLRLDPEEYNARARTEKVTPRAAAYDLSIETVAAATGRSKAEVIKALRVKPRINKILTAKLPPPLDRKHVTLPVLLPVQITTDQGRWLRSLPKGSVARMLSTLDVMPEEDAIRSAGSEVIRRSTSFMVSGADRNRLYEVAIRLGVTISAVFRAVVNAERAKPASRKAA